METDANVQKAEERKTRLRELIRRSVTFAIICGYLSVVNHFTFPYPWVLWVIGAWGISVALQWTYYMLDC